MGNLVTVSNEEPSNSSGTVEGSKRLYTHLQSTAAFAVLELEIGLDATPVIKSPNYYYSSSHCFGSESMPQGLDGESILSSFSEPSSVAASHSMRPSHKRLPNLGVP